MTHAMKHTMNTQRRYTWSLANHFISISKYLLWYVLMILLFVWILRIHHNIIGNTQIVLCCRIAWEFGEFWIVIVEDFWFCLWHCTNRRFRVYQTNISNRNRYDSHWLFMCCSRIEAIGTSKHYLHNPAHTHTHTHSFRFQMQ